MIKHQPKTTLTAVGALVASLALVGCGRSEDVAQTPADVRTAESSAAVETRVGDPATDASQAVAEAARDTTQATGEAARDTTQATGDAARDTTQATGDAARDAAQATGDAARDAAGSTREAARDAAQATQSAADQATDKVSDALITTSVNTELAKDPALSALRIDVDTDNGRVVLSGTAPDEAAKARAEELARGVEGVRSVENQLSVRAG